MDLYRWREAVRVTRWAHLITSDRSPYSHQSFVSQAQEPTAARRYLFCRSLIGIEQTAMTMTMHENAAAI